MCVRNKTSYSHENACNCLLQLPIVLLLPLLLSLICPSQAEPKADPTAVIGLGTAKPSLDLHTAPEASNLEQLIESKLNETAKQHGHVHSQDVLSRKRRYLVFPEGSSFQMVYDEYVCVVDFTNYLVLGITVALAWELPSKPPSELLEDVRTKLLDEGNIEVSRNDTASNITYVDNAKQPQQGSPGSYTGYSPNYINFAKPSASNAYYSMAPVFHTPMHPSYKYADSYYRRPTVPPGWRRKDNHYYSYYNRDSSSRNPFEKWTKPFNQVASHKITRFPYWALASRLRDTMRKHHSYYTGMPSQQYASPPLERRQGVAPDGGTYITSRKPFTRHHRIFSVFGKRSIPDPGNPHHRQRRSGVASESEAELSRLDRIQIKYHRTSRQALYERIEKYLNKRGQHGHHCVLRTLCETGQKSHEKEPGTFVGELMRAVFTIPEALEDEPVAYQNARYDKAHAHNGDCAALYPECKQSMWEANFVQ